MKNKFKTVEEEQCWVRFSHEDNVYDLSHLDAHKVVFIDGKLKYEFIVTYSFHVFAKESADLSDEEHDALMFGTKKESRPFNHERYHLSLQLPSIIEGLAEAYCFHADRGSFATCKLTSASGEEVNYKVVFKAFREKKKLRIHVTTAFPLAEDMGKATKVKFLTIAKKTLEGKKVKVPK